METANLSSLIGLGIKTSSPLGQLEPSKKFVNAAYSVGIGQSLFAKHQKQECINGIPRLIKDEDLGIKEEDIDLDVDQLTSDHVPLGEILERLQSEEKFGSNLIRLHGVNESNATISATVNVATLDISSPSSLQQHLSEINDVLFHGSKPTSPITVTSTSTIFPTHHTLSHHGVPEVSSIFNNNNNSSSPSGDESSHSTFCMSPGQNQHGYETKSSPQECNLCNKMFGNASALAKHRLTHSDERRYLCNVCHKAFKRQDHLNGHLLTHRNKKPFECMAEGCNKSYCDARSLRRHRENHHSKLDEKLVSPVGSVTSVDSKDTDEKSLGSESCDNSLKCTKVVFTGINSIDKDKNKMNNDTHHFQLIEQIIRETKESEASNAKLQNASSTSQHTTFHTSSNNSRSTNQDSDPHQNMVECSICSRKFKNIPALNGHMRLHGGYYRKDNDKKHEKNNLHNTNINNHTSPGDIASSHTISSNVRALIEEKIIQKRKHDPSVSPGRTQFSQIPNYTISLNSQACSTICSNKPGSNISSNLMSPQLGEPPSKKLALDSKAIQTTSSSTDNLSYPILIQPETAKLLRDLQNRQRQIASSLPSSGTLPCQPLPNIKFLPSQQVAPKPHTHVKPALTNLLKPDRTGEPRVGPEFQADVPDMVVAEDSKYGIISQETLMWDPDINDRISYDQLASYLSLASSCAVYDTGHNTENAMQILLRCSGDIVRATQQLLTSPVKGETTSSLRENEECSWTTEEVDLFYVALCKHKKDFSKISGELRNKSSQDCVEFYYMWKNLCREESQSFKNIINTDELPLPSEFI